MVKSIEQAGSGNLMQQFEDLKKKLDSEGLFDLENKLHLPESPKHIGVITSSSTAAFQDILSTIQRRAPSAQVSLSKSVVQGDTAPRTIIKALNRILLFNENNEDNPIDVVILSRGGGSIEDLWCFNNEELAREIFAFPIPTISGVGHEIDFTICDFVSDTRSPTPTAAAELVTEFNFKAFDRLEDYFEKLVSRAYHLFKLKRHAINSIKSNLKSPLIKLREQNQRLDSFELRLKQNIQFNTKTEFQKLNTYYSRLMERNPKNLLQKLDSRIKNISKLIEINIKNKLSIKELKIKESNKNLLILNPLSILDRGYAIIQNKNGQAIKTNSDVLVGENLTARLSEGFLDIEVKTTSDKK
jgi:exodeoxyribonuclease VII large subunit